LVSNIKPGILLKFFNTVYENKLLNSFFIFMLLCLVEFIRIVRRSIRNRKIDWVWTFILSLLLYQFILSAAGAHAEYHRLMAPVYPLVFVLIFKYLYSTAQYILKKGLKIQFFRYALVGGAASVADIAIYSYLTGSVMLHPILSNTVSFITGLLINYFMSRKWVFNQQTHNFRKDFSLFAVIGLIGLLLSNLILYILLDIGVLYNILFFLGDNFIKLAAKLVAVIIVLFWNFAARKRFVFSRA
jgi:putative flippase GtrA